MIASGLSWCFGCFAVYAVLGFGCAFLWVLLFLAFTVFVVCAAVGLVVVDFWLWLIVLFVFLQFGFSFGLFVDFCEFWW